MATALVTGNMIGSGVFLLPASLAAYGGMSIVGWLFTAAGAMLLALVFSRLGRAFPKIGGPYAYARMGFGDFIGFEMAWGYWISIWTGNAAIATAFVGYLAVFWPALGRSPVLGAAVAITAIWVLTGVNALGVRSAGWVQLVTTIGKLIPLFAIGMIGIFFIDIDHFVPFHAGDGSPFSAVTAVAALTLWAFLGLESATIPAEDVDDPARTIPRATVLGTAVAAVVYILGTVAVMGVIPAVDLAQTTAPFADAARALWGSWAGYAVAIGALLSTFGALNGWILLQGQIPRAAARDGLFPAGFGRLSGRGTPIFGLLVSSVIATVLLGMRSHGGLVEVFTFVVLLATISTLVPYLFTTMAELLLFINERERFRGERLAGSATIAVLAFAYSLWAIVGAGQEAVFWGVLLLFAGMPVYVWMRWRSRAERALKK
ncbi:MAG: amino acid permease [bacterium]|nr:amino acid permease [bacterium]